MALPDRLTAVVRRDPDRAHWMELFFDLVFVAFLGVLAHPLHDHPGVEQFVLFIVLFFPAWWVWINLAGAVNLNPSLSPRGLGIAMLGAMLAVGLMASAAPDGLGERAWAFALGNAALRVILLVLWIRRSRREDALVVTWRVVTYNAVTAGIWLVSVFLPNPINLILWAIAILIECMLLLVVGTDRGSSMMRSLSIEHIAERMGLFVIIVLGESVLTLVTEVADTWTIAAGLTAVAGFAIVALVAWAFFMYGSSILEQGLQMLRAKGAYGRMRDTVMFLPFVLVVGVTVLAASLATAVHDPLHVMAPGSAAALGGGLALFYLTNAIVSLNYGFALRRVMGWAPLSVGLALLLIPVALIVPAWAALLAGAIVMLALVTLAEVRRRQWGAPGPSDSAGVDPQLGPVG